MNEDTKDCTRLPVVALCENLRNLANKATPGEWWIDSHGHTMVSFADGETHTVFVAKDLIKPPVRHPETGNLSHWPNDWDASFIATANPSNVLLILDALTDAKARLAEKDARIAELERQAAMDGGLAKLALNAAKDQLASAEAALDKAQALNVELRAQLKAAPAERGDQLPMYTCTGKGGEYVKLGYAKPAGAIKTIQGDSGLIVYRDTATGQLYFRDPADFNQRMSQLADLVPCSLGGDMIVDRTCAGGFTRLNPSPATADSDVPGIPVEHEDEATVKEFGGIVESCHFCGAPTRYWHTGTNNPVCPDCAKKHRVEELPNWLADSDAREVSE